MWGSSAHFGHFAGGKIIKVDLPMKLCMNYCRYKVKNKSEQRVEISFESELTKISKVSLGSHSNINTVP